MLSDYLKGRKQFVVMNRFSFSELPVLSGVPQGSILGSTSFVPFSDIAQGLKAGNNITMLQ